MNWQRYIVTLCLFVAVVSIGVNTTLFELNRMVNPAGPVEAFRLKACGPGSYEVEFLGEKAGLELPISSVANFSPSLAVGRCEEYAASFYTRANQDGGLLLRDVSLRLYCLGRETTCGIAARAVELKERLLLLKRPDMGGAEE